MKREADGAGREMGGVLNPSFSEQEIAKDKKMSKPKRYQNRHLILD